MKTPDGLYDRDSYVAGYQTGYEKALDDLRGLFKQVTSSLDMAANACRLVDIYMLDMVKRAP